MMSDLVIRYIVDRVHVGTSDDKVERIIRRRKGTDADVRKALSRHRRNLEEYRQVMGGLR